MTSRHIKLGELDGPEGVWGLGSEAIETSSRNRRPNPAAPYLPLRVPAPLDIFDGLVELVRFQKVEVGPGRHPSVTREHVKRLKVVP